MEIYIIFSKLAKIVVFCRNSGTEVGKIKKNKKEIEKNKNEKNKKGNLKKLKHKKIKMGILKKIGFDPRTYTPPPPGVGGGRASN